MFYNKIMNRKKYQQIRALVMIFVTSIVMLSINTNSYLLALAGVVTGMIFLGLARSKTKITVDEREQLIGEKAARLTYAIFTPTIGLGSFLLLVPSYSGLSVFDKGDFIYLESLGMVLSYLTLFLIVTYSLSYFFLNKKYGGDSEK